MQVHKANGDYTASYLDLQQVSKLAPDRPGMLKTLQQAATLCLQQDRRQGKQSVCSRALFSYLLSPVPSPSASIAAHD